MSSPRYLCIHGHFYQPPRENPWLEAVEIQDSAMPYHDWNERITRECYGPNSRARLVCGEGRIIGLLNNYAWMSYNFGPTLLDWMDKAAPDVLHGIVEGDRLSRERRGGHGNALAQVYNHVIMPLASDRDKETQLRWGIADFRYRFGREPEGMWLAETAADTASLEALAAAGIRFTVLAPRQAKRWRRLGDDKWTEVAEGIDPSRAYLCRLPSGRTIVLFFYDGRISQQVAFERLLDSGEKFLDRLLGGIDNGRQHPQLMHIATDGESYGHHHAHGDMALAYVLNRLKDHPEIRLTNYGEFLELHPPEWEVEIHDNSSWSCVHGVERWRSNCGCNSGRGWQQQWRGPLRDAFNLLKGRLDALFEQRGRKLLRDPWAARNDYVSVLLNRNDETVRQFVAEHAVAGRDGNGVRDALRLLEMQRHGLLMYTSCGWFFDELSGLETTQCLRYAARAMQLAANFGVDFEPDFLQVLEKAPSNLPELKNGRAVWEKYVGPSRVDLERVLAHYAISLVYRPPQDQERVYTFDLETIDQEVAERGDTHLAMSRLKARSRITTNEREASFVVVHYGGLDFHAVLREARSPEEYAAVKKELFETFAEGSLADVTALVAREFQGQVYRLDDLFLEEQRRVINIALQQRLQDYAQEFERLANQDADMLHRLGRLSYPVPAPMGAAAALNLNRRLLEQVGRLDDADALNRIQQPLEHARAWGFIVDGVALGRKLEEELQVVFAELNPSANLRELVCRAGLILDAAFLLGITLDLWKMQNQLLDAYAQLEAGGTLNEPLRDAFAQLTEKLNMSPQLLGWRP